MVQYNVTGMTCAACSARVEKAVSAVKGVDNVSVNLLTNSMLVSGNASSADVINAVEKAGYGASVKGNESKSDKADELKDTQTPKLLKRLISSVALLIPLMYVSMGHSMWGWWVPPFLNDNPMGIAIFELLFTVAIMVINRNFFISGFKGIIHKAPNMDTLVALGSGSAFVYSTAILFLMTIELTNGNLAQVHHYLHNEMYYESAAMILTLITVGKTLEAYSKGKTTNALKSLMSLAPDTATVIRNGEAQTIPAEEVVIGDTFIIKSGESFPVDGIVISGESAADESALTGESIPVDKAEGDRVNAGTVNLHGYLECKAVSVGKDTSLSKIIQMVSDASATKAPIAKIADKVSGVFVPAVIVISIITMICWIIAGEDAGFVLARGISVLVISCPCALGLATPVAIMVGSGKGAKNGILFKTAESLEQCGKTDIVCFDKTGTITKGNPSVTDIISNDNNRLLKYAYSAESKSEHPLSRAVVSYCEENNISLINAEKFKAFAGNGICAEVDGKTVYAGNEGFISKYVSIPEEMAENAQRLSRVGKTPLYFSLENELLGLIAVADTVKNESRDAVERLSNMGVQAVMITGDTQETANAVANSVGIKNVVARVLPDEKEAKVRALSQFGSVAMIGDGINDAPALTRADTGIAVGAGTDVAIESADVVLMKSNPLDVSRAINLSRRVLLNIKENLFWAFIYNIIGIPIAAGVLYKPFGLTLNPMFAAAAMSLSSFCVVINALRLNTVNIDKIYHRRNKKGDIDMSIFKKEKKPYIVIEGLMCSHCEAAVTKALAEIGLTVTADHTKNKAVIESGEADEEAIRKAVTDAGYKFVEIKK